MPGVLDIAELPPGALLIPGALIIVELPPAALLIPVALAPSPAGIEASPEVVPPGVVDIPCFGGAPEVGDSPAGSADAPESVVAGSSLPPQPISAAAQHRANPENTQRRIGRN